MGSINSLLVLALAGCIGLTSLVLGCALFNHQWWPLFVIIFYVLSPMPILISKRASDSGGWGSSESNGCADFAWFITTGLVVSAFGLPIVFAAANVIDAGACVLVFIANLINFAAIYSYFKIFRDDTGEPTYALW